MNDKISNTFTTRPPIICVAGHIDHGKTTLLNCLSETYNPQKEYGGITQHIKSYYVNTTYGLMTFLDTPGHFAFNSNRENCIKISDIVLIVISLEDGIKPQSIESINLAKKFNVPIVIVLNKADKVDHLQEKSDKILNELLTYNLVSEKWGGDTLVSLVSAKTKYGIDGLLNNLKLQADIIDLNVYGKLIHGIILENRMDINKGYVTTLILKDGILKKGMAIKIADNIHKIKNLFTADGEQVILATPSLPINIIGIDESIDIGENFTVVTDCKKIKKKSESLKLTDNLFSDLYNVEKVLESMTKIDSKKINIILKVDVKGSLKVVKDLLENLSTDLVKIILIKYDIGSFNETDIELSKITKSLMIGFNIKLDSRIKKLSADENIKINVFNVVYDILDFMQDKIESEKVIEHKPVKIGVVEVKKVFQQKDVMIAGCLVLSGKVKILSNVKIFRNNNLIYEGVVDSIKIFKNDVKEVRANSECGIIIKKYNKLQVNDVMEVY